MAAATPALLSPVITQYQSNTQDDIRELIDEGEDGFINFSIVVEDSAGNSTGEVIETSDGSYVWFDGTRPTLSYVTFNSTNANDSSLAIIGDTF